MRYLLPAMLLCWSIAAPAQYFDTLHLYYPIGDAALSKDMKQTLDSFATTIGSRKMLVYSYADYLGSEKPNLHLSDRRAMGVKQYLLLRGLKPEQFLECAGLGQVPGSGSTTGDPQSRRTDIFIRRTQAAVKVPATPVKAGPGPDAGMPVDSSRVSLINLDSLPVNAAIALNHIEFYPGQALILPQGYPELEHLYQVMRDHPRLKVRLEGHVCCCVYPDGYFENTPTWGLSVARARVIYEHLITRGIDAARLEYQGFGRTRPIRENEQTIEEGRVNRRVEARILEK